MTQLLDDTAQMICQKLATSRAARSFYLAGGTGLALQLKHRVSMDLDFLQVSGAERIPNTRLTNELTRLFGRAALRVDLRQMDQVHWSIHGTKVTFMAYPFRLIYPLVDGSSLATWLTGISVADQREIAAMKAYALGRRATFRDYVDLFYLLQSGVVTLPVLIRDASSKYRVEGTSVFSTKLFLEQLCYLDDLPDLDATLRLLVVDRPALEDLKAFLVEQVRSFLAAEPGSHQHAPTGE
jgi:predicted nucleotidyltransferase component of viral defense system